MIVFDASALLAYVQGERGAEVVLENLERGGVCSAINWSEVSQKVRAAGADWELVRALLLSFDLAIEPVTEADAERAASLWRRGEQLSIADRVCLSLAHRLGLDVLTCDTEWAGRPGVVIVR